MAEFQEVIRQKNRMCNSVLCCKCDIYRLCDEEISKCPQFIRNNPKKAEEVIMSWAAEHPEPVYPTWFEWMEERRILAAAKSVGTETIFDTILPTPAMFDSIPADLAEALKIPPKEGV